MHIAQYSNAMGKQVKQWWSITYCFIQGMSWASLTRDRRLDSHNWYLHSNYNVWSSCTIKWAYSSSLPLGFELSSSCFCFVSLLPLLSYLYISPSCNGSCILYLKYSINIVMCYLLLCLLLWCPIYIFLLRVMVCVFYIRKIL